MNQLLSELGLFTPHNCGVSCSFHYLKSQSEFKSRLHIPEFSGYHCTSNKNFIDTLNSQKLKGIESLSQTLIYNPHIFATKVRKP